MIYTYILADLSICFYLLQAFTFSQRLIAQVGRRTNREDFTF
jgi:hypothetical protein